MIQDQLFSIAFPAFSLLEEHKNIQRNLPFTLLIENAIKNGEGRLADSGALTVKTGKFTGRSPEDKYIVRDEMTEHLVDWGKINNPFDSSAFEQLYFKMYEFIKGRTLYVNDCLGGASKEYELSFQVVTTKAWQALFANNQFLKPGNIMEFTPEWIFFSVPEFEANPETDGTRNKNFTIIDFSRKVVLIGGTEYAGEIKKSLFTILNFILPVHHGVLPMHCSATAGKKGDVALFFGLSGTGKTTLSSDPERCLIGDDEHGWSDEDVFNFEGGCYAKVIHLNAGFEPGIFNAIRFGTLLENVTFEPGGSTVNFDDDTITENTRASYPLSFADVKSCPCVTAEPSNIFFLTADATGVLPPIAVLNTEQAKAFFLTGYTSKLAGTEMGVNQPKPTFSACFGAAFMPLPPMFYADLLQSKIEKSGAKVWLINTGWTKGPYGKGYRIPITATRTFINGVLSGNLNTQNWTNHPVFGIAVPTEFPGVDAGLLETKVGWDDENAYLKQANQLLKEFIKNLANYVGESEAINMMLQSH
jgi:phosphoenolpyruvate carboxykinase (ATP)